MTTVLAAGLALAALAGCGDGSAVTTTSEATGTTQATTTTQELATTQATTTTEAPTTTAGPVQKTPAATADELVEALYAAINAKDNAAYRALNQEEARHQLYLVNWAVGQFTDNIGLDYDLSADSLEELRVLGVPVVSGDAVAVPVAYDYPGGASHVYLGFDVLVMAHVAPAGLLVAGAGHFLTVAGRAPDPAVVQALVEAEAAAWNAGDADGVLATMTEDAVFWEDVTDVGTYHTGAALRQFVEDSLWFSIEVTGAPVFNGAFVAVPNRLVAEDDSSEGISIYWIRDGKIAFHAFAQGR